MTYNKLPFNTGKFQMEISEWKRVWENKYIIFDVEKLNLSNFLDKDDQLFWNWIVSKLFFKITLIWFRIAKNNRENSNLIFLMVWVHCAPILSLSLVSAQKSCTWPISPLCFPSPSVTVYFSPSLFNSLLVLLRSAASSFPLLFSPFLRFLIPPPSPHLARTLQFSQELVPSSIPIDASSSV